MRNVTTYLKVPILAQYIVSETPSSGVTLCF